MTPDGAGARLAFSGSLLHNVAQLPALPGSLLVNSNLDLDSTEL